MSVALRGLQPWVRPNAQWALDVAARYGVKVTVTSVRRTWVQQNELYSRYQRAVANGTFPSASVPYPANPPGFSSHNYGLSWDSDVAPHLRAWWAHVRTLAGFRVPANDVVHAEVPNWRSYVS